MGIERDCVINGERFALVVETRHEPGVTAWTAVHRQDFDRRIGGARTVVAGHRSEVGYLSAAMTQKCAAAWLPADGEKTLVVTGAPLPDESTRIRLLREHLAAVVEADPGVIFGPDMNNGEPVMDAVARADLDHTTGLSDAEGGVSIDTFGYTAVGLDEAIATAMRVRGLELRTATIQGFGAVGAHAGRLLADRGIRILAANFKHGTFIAEDDAGLDMAVFFPVWQDGGDAALRKLGESPPAGVRFTPDANAILGIEADIFVPAARTGVLALESQLAEKRAGENPDCQSIEEYVRDTGVKVIVEGANHPLSNSAVDWCDGYGVLVLKDYIVNCGGLIGCYVEWAYRDELRSGEIELEEMGEKTLRMVRKIVQTNVESLLDSQDGILETAEAIARSNRETLLANRAASDLGDHAFAKQSLEDHLKN